MRNAIMLDLNIEKECWLKKRTAWTIHNQGIDCVFSVPRHLSSLISLYSLCMVVHYSFLYVLQMKRLHKTTSWDQIHGLHFSQRRAEQRLKFACFILLNYFLLELYHSFWLSFVLFFEYQQWDYTQINSSKFISINSKKYCSSGKSK